MPSSFGQAVVCPRRMERKEDGEGLLYLSPSPSSHEEGLFPVLPTVLWDCCYCQMRRQRVWKVQDLPRAVQLRQPGLLPLPGSGSHRVEAKAVLLPFVPGASQLLSKSLTPVARCLAGSQLRVTKVTPSPPKNPSLDSSISSQSLSLPWQGCALCWALHLGTETFHSHVTHGGRCFRDPIAQSGS